uniref:Putative pyridoxal dependent aminotransferase, DegT/DnrJ/EryC1/StrS types.Putative glutamine--scyllo-inositol transaminase. Putative UDP-4-amino-4-deoxy-L-arabinose--oxoglutarate aminotransferase n=1 Tax=Magnetococcus massalia (strain MO-1) TaxID=451514 RepID=A0A1S7LQ52_MAGMO|nr:Putative pyridoxal dependent aminotransferase, DegT/DnrJ/EryC1/StrS types.Putative glutamine--scyllo-inositol transaminase. Putative UDP-4-amino-4-deoxy-L-arabinose--oxoglutarate aminotransferase [Candidatus Magnetococcus massalia]
MSSQYTIPLWNIDVGEAAAEGVAEAIRNRHISQGALTEAFETELARMLDVPYALCTTSGTVALMLSLRLLGVEPGDEIILPARSWVATANAAMLLGAKPILVDIEASRPVIDPWLIESAITPRTRAIMPVHLNGIGCQMDAIGAIGEKYEIPIVEDACQAIFSRQGARYLGTFGRLGCFSLGLAKMLPTGQGGVIVCHDRADYETLCALRNQGQRGGNLGDQIYMLGGNFKFTDMQAAMGLAQLPIIPRRIEHQLALQKVYEDGLCELPGMQPLSADATQGEHPLRAEWLCTWRHELLKTLNNHSIHAVAQGLGLHELPHIQPLLPMDAHFPNANRYSATFVTLPSGPEQPLENAQRTVDVLRANHPSASL